MEAILQDEVGVGNLQPLPKSLNSSKGALDPGNPWTTYKGNPLDADYAANLRTQQMAIQAKIQAKIQEFQKINQQAGH